MVDSRFRGNDNLPSPRGRLLPEGSPLRHLKEKRRCLVYARHDNLPSPRGRLLPEGSHSPLHSRGKRRRCLANARHDNLTVIPMKMGIHSFCHSALDAESRIYRYYGFPIDTFENDSSTIISVLLLSFPT
jgi:hypothetical protein